jgi:hypothetical protein
MSTRPTWRRVLGLTAASLLVAACGVSRPTPTTVDPLATPLPRYASRFPLEALTDSTVRFRPEEARWMQKGLTGIAVDPSHGDALVARVKVTHVHADSAVALVTGQTTRVVTGQVLLFLPPTRRPWRERVFWYGAAASAGVFGLAGLVLLLLD